MRGSNLVLARNLSKIERESGECLLIFNLADMSPEPGLNVYFTVKT